MSAEVSSSWQSNATVWKMAYGNGDIWMVGDFTSLRPPGDPLGTGEQPADYFAALKASTGAPDPAIDDTHIFSGQSSGLPLTNGAVAVSPDGSTVYVGGSFTTVDGLSRNHIAAFSTSTGALLSWNPNVSGKVSAIATFGNVVYVGGSFAKVGKTTVGTNFAAINATTGAAMSWGTGTTPSFDNTVDALAVSSDGSQVVAGGYFSNVDGLSQSADGTTVYNKAAIIGGVTSSTPGALEPMPADAVAVPPGTDAAPVNGCTSDVKFATISGGVAYIADEGTGGGCFDGVWAVNLSDGSLKWVNRCLGATQVLAVIGNYVYKGSHAHDCQENNTNGPVSDDPANFPQVDTNHARHLLSLNTSNGFLGPWYPFSNAGPNLGPRAMATDGTQLYVGGDFTTMNYVGQQGIARFTTTNDYPTPKPAQPVAVASGPGSINVYAQAPVDLDDVDLTMELFRDGGTTPIASQNVTSYFWQQPVVGFTDSGLQLGSQHTYKVEAVETYGTGSSPMSVASAPVTVSNGSTGYAATVLSQNPVGYWRFGESGGTIAADSSPSLNGGVYTGGVTLGQPGGILGDSNTAMTLDGSTGYFSSGQSEPSPSVFSAEAWFKTTTTSGGKIIGFGNNQTGDSSNYDKHIYMTNSGQLIFGTYNGGTDIIQTTKSYNDGQWHQVVGTQGPSGMSLYVDGVKVGSNPTTTNQTYNGFWRVGEDNLNGWPSQPSSNYFGGSIDEASVYNTALTPQQVAAQYTAAGYTLPTLPGSNTPYAKTVIADGPSLYWRLDETSGNTANDLSGNADNGLYNTGDTLGVPGAINDGSSPADTAISTDGNDDGVMVSTSQTPSPSTFSIEAWFKTTNPNGKIIGFGNSSSPTGSGNYDKHIYFNNGVLNFGVWNNEEDVVSAPASPNLADGQWHHVVATQDSSGMKLYVDGNLVASNGVTTNQSYNGYWHVGGDSGWGSVQDYQGSVDEVAIYPYALSAAQVLNDYQIGTGQSTTPTPPPAPGAPTVSSSSPTTAHVAWSTVAGASSYKVLRSVSGANNFAYVATGVTGTSFDDSGLTPGGSYDYEVVASNAGGDSPPSGLTTITTVPAQPGTLTASTNGTSEIDLSWGAATGATSYDVWRSPSGANTFTDQATVNGTTYSDTGLNPGDAYDYEVIPSDSAGPGATSNIASATTLPAKVTGLNPNAVSSTEIDLTWNTATGASTYVVQRAPHGSSNWTTISSGSSATSYNDTGLNPGTTYDYQVAAVDNGGTGAFSDTQSATTNQVPPGQVTGVHANAVSPTEIDLTWGATPGATAYEVDRSTVSGTSGFSPVATGLSSPSYNDIGLSPNTPYWYQVIASNSAGPGPASTAASATTPALNPAVLANSFEGGTSGTAITAANSGGGSGNKFDSVSCTGGTATYSTNSAHGTLAAALTPGTSPCYLQWGKTSITSTSTTSYGRSYLYLAANPAVTEEFAHLGDSSFNRDAQINISTAGKITLYDANNTKQATFTQSLPLNTWLRVEWTLVNSTTSGSLTVSVYSGDSTTPIESHTVSGINTGTAFGSLQIGQVLSSSTAPGTIRLDDVAFGTTGPLGPGT
ncbi:MAG TPA: LamG-like jellyroll fold domain-containing protein [Mycobacteriales bacterium]|nr:LamG-like jellyroll fold domain-containing protein [Mycobacteriales bacterium]